MKKHTKSAGGGQAQGLSPYQTDLNAEVFYRLDEIVCDAKGLFRGQYKMQTLISLSHRLKWGGKAVQSDGDAVIAVDRFDSPFGDREERHSIVLLHGLPLCSCAFSVRHNPNSELNLNHIPCVVPMPSQKVAPCWGNDSTRQVITTASKGQSESMRSYEAFQVMLEEAASLHRDDCLNRWANPRYTVGVAAKSAAGIETPRTTLEPTHAPTAWFFVGTRPPFTWVLLAYPAIGIYSVMVARAGQPSGWSVSKVADSLNPVRATTMRLRPQVGSDNLSTLEAAIMATVPTPLTPVVRVIDGQAVTTSLDLAEYFGKNHHNVLRKIQSLDCSLEFTALNFEASTYTDPTGRECPCYLLTRDGFFFVAMGFTGRRAAEFKEAYIAAFNAMEQQLRFPDYLAQLDQAHLRDAVWATLQHLAVIRQAWDEQLYPGLKALGSPLAVSLHDRVHLACWSLQTIAKHSGCELTMSEALAATRPPVFPRAQACGLRAVSVGGQRRQGGRHE